MKIIILGAGRVGTSVAKNLVSERNDITLIDNDPTRLVGLQDRYDLRVLVGSGTHISVLESAGAADADMLIACTASDESNLVACRIARQVFNIPQRIARIRSNEFVDRPDIIGAEGFCIDHLISPERSVTAYLERLVRFPEALQVADFADDNVTIVLVRVGQNSLLLRQTVADIGRMFASTIHVLAIFRDERPIQFSADTVFQIDDEVLVLIETQHLRSVMHELAQVRRQAHRIMIGGGGNIGARIARELSEQGYQVKLIEHDPERCERLASSLPANVLVLNGDVTDEALLEEENIDSIDVFLAVTDQDESNIMSALLAKRMGARRVMSLIARKSYDELMEGSRIDVAVAPDQTTIGELLRYVRRGDVVKVHKIRRGSVEALEAIVHGDANTSRVVGRRLGEIPLPSGATMAAVVRGDSVLLPTDDPVIESGDHVIVLVMRRRLLPQVERLFQVAPSFF